MAMWLAIQADAFHPQFIHFGAPVRNTVIESATFARIIYAPPHFAMNGLFMHMHMTDKLGSVETAVLNAYGGSKPRALSLNRPIHTNYTVLKISGVWETDRACGVAYKFIQA